MSKSRVPNFDDPVPHLPIRDGLNKLNMLNTSPIEVAKIIRILKKSSFSHCGVPGKFLGLISTPISFSMSRLFNNFFEIGYFPEMWKISHITPIYKRSSSKSCKTSYRPISLLPTISKCFESVMHDRLLKHCLENKLGLSWAKLRSNWNWA